VRERALDVFKVLKVKTDFVPGFGEGKAKKKKEKSTNPKKKNPG